MKSIFIGFVFTLVGISVIACDLHNGTVGTNPLMNRNFVSFGYKHSQFFGQHTHLQETSSSHDGHNHSHGEMITEDLLEYYGTYEVGISYYVLKNIQLMANIPFVTNKELLGNTKIESVNGIGDAMFMARYRVDKEVKKMKTTLLFGGGTYIPTGKYKIENNLGGVNPLIQPGRGVFRFFGSASASVSIEKIGFLMDINYTINNQNSINYQFANRTNGSLQAYYQFDKKETSLFPTVGLYTEFSKEDKYKSKTVNNTGGMASFVTTGTSFKYKKLLFSFTYLIPVIEKMNGTQGENLSRVNTSINFNF